MRIEEVVSSFIMCIVSGLVLVGFTIAWYTNNNLPAVTGMEMTAAEMGDVKVALVSGGEDISKLEGDAKYADIGLGASDALNPGKLAPGSYGKVTFYVTPTQSNVTACNIKPLLLITQDGSTWYPAIEENGSVSDGDSAESVSEGDVSGGNSVEEVVTLKELYGLAQGHLQFFADEAMTQPVDVNKPILLEWTLEERLQDVPVEKTVKIYWKWHYEYPFSATEEATLSVAEKKLKVDKYDEEDMLLGNHISGMKFYFTFIAQ